MFDQDAEASPAAAPYKEIYPTAAALLWQDRRLIAALYGVLVITSLLMVGLPASSKGVYFAAGVLDRLLQLLFTYVVAVRWIQRLSQSPRVIGTGATARFFLFGLGLWCLFTVPLGLAGSSDSPFLVSLSFFLFGSALWFGLRYYFYPVPILLGRTPLGAALGIAADISREERILPVKLLLAPCGFLSLLLAAVMSFSPDGRAVWTSYAAELVAGTFWVFATYLALAAALLRLDTNIWREEGLDPYRTARLSTLEFQGSSWLARQLKPAHGAGWLLVSAIVWVGNLVRLFSMPPPGTVTVSGVTIDGPKVTISLHLSDPEYHFNGLQPMYFALAGEQRAVISQSPESSRVRGSTDDALLDLPHDRTELDLDLQFKANRSGKELAALQDLYLWYRSAKLEKLALEKSDVKP